MAPLVRRSDVPSRGCPGWALFHRGAVSRERGRGCLDFEFNSRARTRSSGVVLRRTYKGSPAAPSPSETSHTTGDICLRRLDSRSVSTSGARLVGVVIDWRVRCARSSLLRAHLGLRGARARPARGRAPRPRHLDAPQHPGHARTTSLRRGPSNQASKRRRCTSRSKWKISKLPSWPQRRRAVHNRRGSHQRVIQHAFVSCWIRPATRCACSSTANSSVSGGAVWPLGAPAWLTHGPELGCYRSPEWTPGSWRKPARSRPGRLVS